MAYVLDDADISFVGSFLNSHYVRAVVFRVLSLPRY
jgi:hypothetical protein